MTQHFKFQAKEFVRRMTEVSTKLASLEKEADGEAAKYGQDIVLVAAFNNAQKYNRVHKKRNNLRIHYLGRG